MVPTVREDLRELLGVDLPDFDRAIKEALSALRQERVENARLRLELESQRHQVTNLMELLEKQVGAYGVLEHEVELLHNAACIYAFMLGASEVQLEAERRKNERGKVVVGGSSGAEG